MSLKEIDIRSAMEKEILDGFGFVRHGDSAILAKTSERIVTRMTEISVLKTNIKNLEIIANGLLAKKDILLKPLEVLFSSKPQTSMEGCLKYVNIEETTGFDKIEG